MDILSISKVTARRFVLGRQGLWPGRRWVGQEGTAEALHTIEAVQMDPLNVVARNHDIVMWSRISGYRPEYLDRVLYTTREFFDYGGALFIYPMDELPFWRLSMRKKGTEARWATFAATHQTLLDEVRAELRRRGPLGNRDFIGQERVRNYRGGKESSLALYYLWITGELMISRRQGFERIYDFREHVAPAASDYIASTEEAEHFFARKTVAFKGLIHEREWANGFSGFLERRVGRAEADHWLQTMVENGELAGVQVEDSKKRWFVLRDDVALLIKLEAGQVPNSWQPLETTTNDEVVFLAPLDIVSTRGRADWLFGFEYIWEVYKPVEKRRWGYYTLPILYGDRLVGRLDPKLERATTTLIINGFWLEDHAQVDSSPFAIALARGLIRFAKFLEVGRIHISVIEPASLRAQIREYIAKNFL